MGMFDYVRCEYPLPGLDDPTRIEFQTKDTHCTMDTYTITKEGRLIRHYREFEATPEEEMPYYGKPEWEKGGLYRLCGMMRVKKGSERDIDTNWHGWLNFYGDAHTGELMAINMKTGEDDLHPGPEPEWFEYNAKFTDGNLVQIERVAES